MVSRTHPAQRGSPWRAVGVATAVSLGAVGALAGPRLGIAPLAGGALAGVAGLLAVLALPSLSTRRVTVLVLGIGALGALRHAALPSNDGELVVVWAVATLIAFVLIDRAEAEAAPGLVGAPMLAARLPEATRVGVAIAAVVAVVAVSVVPTLTRELGRYQWLGDLPTFADADNAPASLRASRQLDMTSRPRLSDRVVFTVEAPRPDFWRGELYDQWDGRTWSRSDQSVVALRREGARVDFFVDPDDDGALYGAPTRQTFHVETRFSDIVFGAPTAVAIETEKLIVGRPDGTAGVVGGFGHGAVYTVTSRSMLPTADDLRGAHAEPVPERVLARYAQPPTTTERVRALAERITVGAPTTYDRIRAIERWLGANTRYSLDAPLSPAGVDVVDHFLFESRLGWCEQVASSMVVLARSVGIPARLATGFVPGERDGLGGRFVVRERDAHAWAEVYFPGVGWQGFDPTASVPLAGDADPSGSWLDGARRNIPEFVLGLAAVVAGVSAAPGMVAAARRSLRRRRSWPASALARLERMGRRAGRPRSPAETPREYANALAAHLHDARLVDVGAAIDAGLFAPDGAPAGLRARADAVLAPMRR